MRYCGVACGVSAMLLFLSRQLAYLARSSVASCVCISLIGLHTLARVCPVMVAAQTRSRLLLKLTPHSTSV